MLDPFGGAGTTGLVARKHGRNAVLIELNPEYTEMARKRIYGKPAMQTLAERLIAAGFAPNVHLLDIIEDPAPRVPASRLFRWPINVDLESDRLTMPHALLAFEPFVQRVMITLGLTIEVDPEPRAGLNTGWHHAVDLATDKHADDLLRTRVYASDRQIMRGVTINLMHGRLSTANARRVLAETGMPEPDDRSEAALGMAAGILRPAFIDGVWRVNLHGRRNPVAEVWAAVHGLEDGWFVHDRARNLRMTPAGIARHMGVPLP